MITIQPEQSEVESMTATGGETLATLFAQVCARFADKAAVTLGHESISYGELDEVADRVAAALMDEGAGAGTIVAICLERSIDMVVAMLGVVKCGAAYLPLDAAYPAQRIAPTTRMAKPSPTESIISSLLRKTNVSKTPP